MKVMPEQGVHNMIRKHIKVRGRVQGVGFRYTAMGLAQKCSLTGWVRNNYDGSVEMEVQGADHRVDLFLQELRSGKPCGNRWIRIDQMDVSEIPLVNAAKEKGFIPRSY